MKHILVLLFACITILAQSQPAFQDITFQEALKKANTEGKLLFLQFEAAACDQCNEVANKGLADANVAKRINEVFVPLLISVNHPDRAYIGQQYNFSNGFGSLFVNQSGTLIHTFHQTSSFPGEYQKQMDLALEKAGESLKVNELEAAYNKGNKSPGLLEALLLKKRSLNLSTDDLLDEYVNALPADSLTSLRTLQFIAQMAPAIGSKADKALRQDGMAFNKAWYQMALPTRVGINNRIIHKSLKNAIATKNEAYAKQVAHFTQSTYSGSPAGAKAHDKQLLRYYEETGDTSNYFKKAIAYYERYYSTALVDSIKRLDSIQNKQMLASVQGDTIQEGNKIMVQRIVRKNPHAQSFTWDLNEAARHFYKTTDNAYYLTIATDWAARGLALYKTPEIMDTYSRLLYKQGQKRQAIAMMKDAIALKKERGFPTTEQEALIGKMKKNQTLE